MPTLWKQIVFSFASILSIGSVVLLVVALSTERWITGTTLCQTGVDLVNASSPELEQFTGHIYYGLFQGGKTRRCGLGIRRSKIYTIQCHRLTEHVANYRESLFTLVIVEENLGFSFWLCVASAVTHGANILVVASSKIHLPKIQTKKPEEPTATGDDFLY
ncbi:hypothetical protein Q8A67_004573 [Cirrhinus molitorella]|uniref:Clarin 2 n=1 Tax=Cirrhinus molitorella TaxID=172907 RepID=A0AA88PYE0_9TELE|nr:hypothetical protein Q8A67_004573 [Cirrhinus molitorella]